MEQQLAKAACGKADAERSRALLPDTRYPIPESRFPPEGPRLRKTVNDLGMRAAGNIAAGLHALLGSRANNRIGILTYHRIAPHVRGAPPPLHNVTPERFREQIGGLLRRDFNVWPLRRILHDTAVGRELPPRTIAITFDDGFETVFTRAWPILRELQAPATVFVNTAYLDSTGPFPFDAWGVDWQGRVPPETYRPLTSAQCRELQAGGLMDLGAHTHTHADFRDRPEQFREDLQLSVDVLRARFGLDEVPFAFPFGSPALGFSGGALAQAARDTGVVCGLTTEGVLIDPRSDPLHWGRFNAFAWDTSATLAAKLAGWYSWAPKLRQRLAGAGR
ncbi:MAG: polysaccharide deacetylase family protein [Planctomycetes bacterium]|nr:polysaccharide deacetylase family protein [Planctomycetota bacterium]